MTTDHDQTDSNALENISSDQVVDQFADADLVPHGFIDLSLPKYTSVDQLADLHSKSSKLLSAMDQHSQDITWKLEAQLGELMRSGNRLSYEVELLKADVSGLVADLDEVAEPTIKTLSTPSRAVERLQLLDKVRSRMIQVKNVFEEAKKFDESRLNNDILALLESGNTETAQERLDEASKLIMIWKGTNIYDSKNKIINLLRKKIEAARTALMESAVSSSEGGSTPKEQSQTQINEGYYGLINQLQKKIF